MATDLHTFPRYQVLFTTLIDEDTYGTEVDVTQDVDITDLTQDISNIINEIDNGDFDIGVFTFGDLTLRCINHDRKFSPAEDWKSIFPYKRDRTKVHVKYYDGLGNNQFSFKGLINDDATRADVLSNDVKFRVFSLDSILRQVRVSGGSVTATQLFSSAIKSILNVPAITNVLTYDPANITVDLDLAIDNGDYFTDLSAKEALDELLLASNSILVVDNTDTVYVKPRTESSNVFYFYGRGDLYGRENILSINNFNTGVQRAFSSVKINETVKTDEAYLELYGFRQKDVSLSFMTDTDNIESIATNILNQFKAPKQELEIEVPLVDSKDIELLDMVSIDLNYRIVPADGEDHVPLYGVAQYGTAKYPQSFGSYKIDPSVKWKVIAIREKPKSLSRVLKLRVAGTEFGDGVF
jgi:hypothetical protein